MNDSEEFLEKALSAAFAVADGGGPPVASGAPKRPAKADSLPERIGRYRIEALVGRGGIGLVLRARDAELDRHVALKILHKHLASDEEMVRRFVAEARLGGSLEHPGVVPVHEMGKAEDGRPYFTMKLVEGETLAARLAARKLNSEDRIGFLSIFQTVCQIVGFAHARGVVHLDLKPSNVLVGGFGETLVTDWGFAARLASAEDAVLRAAASGGRARIVGTPAYMSPEQARGDQPRLGCRSDVFALGAMLCEILTGAPAYSGDSASEILLAASRAWLDDAWKRLEGCPADAALVALARKCLAADPEVRPADAGAVAAEIGGYLRSLEERAQALAIEAAEARTRAVAERRQRRLVVALAALGGLAVVLALGTWFMIDRAAREREREDDRLITALAERVRMFIDRARASSFPKPELWEDPTTASRLALEVLRKRGLGNDVLTPLIDLSAIAEQGKAAALQDDRTMGSLEAIHERYGDLRESALKDQDYGRAFRAAGIDVDALGVEGAASRVAASPIRLTLVTALDDWAHCRRSTGKTAAAAILVDTANRVDPDEWRIRVRSALTKGDTPALEALAASPERDGESAQSQLILATALRRVDRIPLATKVLEEATRRHPGTYDLHHELAMLRRDQPPVDLNEAVRQFSMALALRPRSPHAVVDLGQVLLQAGKLAEAEPLLEDARRLDPDYPPAWHYLGALKLAKRDYEGAELLLRRAVGLDPGAAISQVVLGITLRAMGRLSDAVEVYQAMLTRNPNRAELWCELGHLQVRLGRFDEALDAFRKGHELGSIRGAAWKYPCEAWIEEAGRLAEARDELAAMGDALPDDPARRFVLAEPALLTGRQLTAAKIMEGALANAPVESVPIIVHVLGARAAAAAATGAGREPIDPKQAAVWRERARTWLTAALDALDATEDGSDERQAALSRFELLPGDPAMAGVRDPARIATLPPEESTAWKALWERVRALNQPETRR